MVDTFSVYIPNWTNVRIGHAPGVKLSTFDFTTLCEEIGRPKRLRALDRLLREQRAGPSLDARIALEIGWLQPYSDVKRGNSLVTGVITRDFFERYPLYAPWFKSAPQHWWNDGAAICNRVPNVPKYSSDLGAALQTIPRIDSSESCTVILRKDGSWTVQIFGGSRLIGACDQGAETIAKACVLAGIDCRIRQLTETNSPAR
jgi:hypothetical protein